MGLSGVRANAGRCRISMVEFRHPWTARPSRPPRASRSKHTSEALLTEYAANLFQGNGDAYTAEEPKVGTGSTSVAPVSAAGMLYQRFEKPVDEYANTNIDPANCSGHTWRSWRNRGSAGGPGAPGPGMQDSLQWRSTVPTLGGIRRPRGIIPAAKDPHFGAPARRSTSRSV